MSIEVVLGSIFSAAFLATIIRISTPILLPALGGLISDLGGVINIALEGQMLMAAFTGVVVSAYAPQWLPGLPSWAYALCGGVVCDGAADGQRCRVGRELCGFYVRTFLRDDFWLDSVVQESGRVLIFLSPTCKIERIREIRICDLRK